MELSIRKIYLSGYLYSWPKIILFILFSLFSFQSLVELMDINVGVSETLNHLHTGIFLSKYIYWVGKHYLEYLMHLEKWTATLNADWPEICRWNYQGQKNQPKFGASLIKLYFQCCNAFGSWECTSDNFFLLCVWQFDSTCVGARRSSQNMQEWKC